ncbi:hypothetical protein, partial [Halomonas citrativorans]
GTRSTGYPAQNLMSRQNRSLRCSLKAMSLLPHRLVRAYLVDDTPHGKYRQAVSVQGIVSLSPIIGLFVFFFWRAFAGVGIEWIMPSILALAVGGVFMAISTAGRYVRKGGMRRFIGLQLYALFCWLLTASVVFSTPYLLPWAA